MSVKFLEFDTYADAMDGLMAMLDRRAVDLDVRHIVITPENYTLMVEQRICENGGAMDVEVLSLSRLYYRLGGEGCLTREGAIMLIKSLIKDADFRCFGRAKGYRGFCEKLYDTFIKLAENCVKDFPDAEGALAYKTEDVAAAYSAYKAAISGKRVDASGRNAITAQMLSDGDFMKNAHVYIVNFESFTKKEREIFDIIGQKALSVGYALSRGEKPITAKIELYNAASEAAALKAAAKRIKWHAVHGVSYSEMGVVCAADYERISRIFREYDIPFYIDKKSKLSEHPLAKYLSLLFRTQRRFARADMISLAKNYYSGVSADEADIFENYCNANFVDYLGFLRQFDTAEPEGETAENVRKRISAAVLALSDGLAESRDAESFCAAVSAAIAFDDEFSEKPRARIETLLSLMRETLSGGTTAFFTEILTEGIAAADLGNLPCVNNGVIIGDVNAFRGSRLRYGLVLGFNEGELPRVETDGGIFSDDELMKLLESGADLTPTAAQRNARSESELRQFLASCDELFLSWVGGEEKRPSPMIYKIRAEYAGRGEKIIDNGTEREQAAIASGVRGDDVAFLTGSENGALEILMSQSEPTALKSTLYAALGGKSDAYEIRPRSGINDAEKLFFPHARTSVSQLQEYYSCPYRHFFKYGLRLKERDKGEVLPIDVGNILHSIAEKYVKSGFDDGAIEGIIAETISTDKLAYEENRRLSEYLTVEAREACHRLKSKLKCDFRLFAAEFKLGGGGFSPLSPDGVELGGAVDYSDAYGEYVRVVDYKSSGSAAKFDESDLYYGIKLQLPLYMASFIKNGYVPAAMLYFPFATSWDNSDDKLRGVYVADETLIRAQDASFDTESSVLTAYYRKDKKTGETKKDKIYGSGAKDLQTLYDYCRRAEQTAVCAVREIKEGYIEPRPYKMSSGNACKYCKYGSVCRGLSMRVLQKIKGFGGGEDE